MTHARDKHNMNTKHNDTCKMAFGKPSQHDDCPRCNELKAGAVPRQGWNSVRKELAEFNTRHNNGSLSAYCLSIAIYHSHCTKETNPSCACGKMSYTD